MTYDGSGVDYSKLDQYKKAKACSFLSDGNGNTTISQITKANGISKVVHVDRSFEFDQFLFWQTGHKNCVTVYGE